MRKINNRIIASLPFSRVILAAVAAFSFAAPLTVTAQTTPMPAAKANMASASASASTMQMRKSMETMHEKMGAMKSSGNPDIDFAMMMIAHHEGAIAMAQAEIDGGKDPAMIKAAKKIIVAQKKEIAQFHAWLKKNPHPM